MVKQKDKWLIISYFSNIDGSAQAHWIDDRLPFIENTGIEICLISSFCGARHNSMLHYRAPSITPGSLKYELGFILRRRGISGKRLKFMETLLFLPLYPFYFLEAKILKLYGESRWEWGPFAAIIGCVICFKKNISAIYSTGGPVGAHIASGLIAKLMGIPWIAELQDPLAGEGIGRNSLSKKVLAFFEKFIFKYATKVIFCAENARLEAERRYPVDKSVTIYPGASIDLSIQREILFNRQDNDKFIIIHAGTLYQSRNLHFFLEGLKRAISECLQLKEHFKLILLGNICTESIKDEIDHFPFPIIKYKGLVKRKEAVIHSIQSDVLLLVQNTDERSMTTIPSKLYEYLLLGKPILGLVYKNEELKQLLEYHGHLTVPANDPDLIKQAILDLFKKWQFDRLQSASIKKSEYTVEKAALQIVGLIK